MTWTKGHKIEIPRFDDLPWNRSHAYLPTPIMLGDKLRVYMAFWDDCKIGRVGYVDLNPDTMRVEELSINPVLNIGEPGMFDDHGVSPTGVSFVGDHLEMFYVGWQLGHTTPYALFTGKATSTDGRSFTRISNVPFLDRVESEPVGRAAAMACINNPNRIYYVGANKWLWFKEHGRYWFDSHISVVFADYSRDKMFRTLLPREYGEFGFARPWVIHQGSLYHMFFVYRTFDNPTKYTQGYAIAENGLDFIRQPNPLPPSNEDWDNTAASHAAVIWVKNRWVLFYQGNDFSASGFGYYEANEL